MTIEMRGHVTNTHHIHAEILGGIQIISHHGKYGVYDKRNDQQLLPILYGEISLREGTSYLWVLDPSFSICGVFDTEVKGWLVPHEFDSVDLVEGAILSFRVYKGDKRGHYCVATDKCTWH